MTPDGLKALRRSLGMTQEEFGEWLTREVNRLDDGDHAQVSPYLRQRIAQWEAGTVPIPYRVKYALAERRIAELEARQRPRQRSKQKPKP